VATPFLNDWDPTYRELVRELIGVALVVALIFFGLLLFAAATLAVGAAVLREDRPPGRGPARRRVDRERHLVVDRHRGQRQGGGASALLAVPMFLIDLVRGSARPPGR